MLDISSATVGALAVHRVGNKSRDEGLTFSSAEVTLTDEVNAILLRHYLGGVNKEDWFFDFYHESDIHLNELYAYSVEVFSSTTSFLDMSRKIARHLYTHSTHPNIAAGDLFVVMFEHIVLDGKVSNALGIFKTEIKESYLMVDEVDGTLGIHKSEGINPSNIQKGAIIIEGGTTVIGVDKISRKSKYWIDSFLKVRPKPNSTRTAALTASVFKQTLGAISDPVEANNYKSEFIELLNSEDTPSLGDFAALGAKYVGEEVSEATTQQVLDDLQLEYDPQLPVEKKRLDRAVRSYMRKLKIAEGIDLVVSNAVNVKSVTPLDSDEPNVLLVRIELEASPPE